MLFCSKVSVSCITDQEGKLLLDPTLLEEKSSRSTFLFTFSADAHRIIFSECSGNFSSNNLSESFEASLQFSHLVETEIRKAIQRKLTNVEERI